MTVNSLSVLLSLHTLACMHLVLLKLALPGKCSILVNICLRATSSHAYLLQSTGYAPTVCAIYGGAWNVAAHPSLTSKRAFM